jgi:hypothetical protein
MRQRGSFLQDLRGKCEEQKVWCQTMSEQQRQCYHHEHHLSSPPPQTFQSLVKLVVGQRIPEDLDGILAQSAAVMTTTDS